MTDRWFYIDTDYAVFGIVVGDDGVIKDAAPIARWMVGKSSEQVVAWLTRHGHVWQELPRGIDDT